MGGYMAWIDIIFHFLNFLFTLLFMHFLLMLKVTHFHSTLIKVLEAFFYVV